MIEKKEITQDNMFKIMKDEKFDINEYYEKPVERKSKIIFYNPGITYDKLMQIFNYDSKTGIFTKKKGNKNYVKDEIMGKNLINEGVMIYYAKKNFPAQNLAWFYMKGIYPVNIIKHIDGDKTHNWIENLYDSGIPRHVKSI